MNSRRLAAALAAPAAVVVAACSSSTSGTGSTHSTAGARSTASHSAAASSAAAAPTDAAGLGQRLEAGMSSVRTAHITLDVIAAGQAVTGAGDEKVNNGKLEALNLSENLPGGAGQLTLIRVAGKTYAKLPSTLNKSGKPYVLVTQNSSNPTIRQLASSIDSSLSSASLTNVGAFLAAADSLKLDGKQAVGGTPATHYSVVVNAAKLPSDFPGKAALTASGITSLPVELWVDGQGRPVQVTEKLTVQGQTVSTKVTITKYNQPVTITAPPADQVGTG